MKRSLNKSMLFLLSLLAVACMVGPVRANENNCFCRECARQGECKSMPAKCPDGESANLICSQSQSRVGDLDKTVKPPAERFALTPSGWDQRGKLKEGDFFEFCSITGNAGIIRYWQITYGGGRRQGPTYEIIKSQDELNAAWSTFRIAPEKPQIDFTHHLLVLILPAHTITQYSYRLDIQETGKTIDFYLNEYHHPSRDSHMLLSQEAILLFELRRTDKSINVKFKGAPGSGGPYPK
jgi:hypothetical protein